MNFAAHIASSLTLAVRQVKATLDLLDDGATIPFIARYRKEATQGLDEVQIAEVQQAYILLQELEKRKASILKTIESQGKLTPELEARIKDTVELSRLEDLYLPYRPKRRTRATMAKERGLEPLAQWLWSQRSQGDVWAKASDFVKDEVIDEEDALQGARDIIAEWINEDEAARTRVRHHFKKSGQVLTKVTKGQEKAGAKYKDYFEFEKSWRQVQPHQFLAIQRAEREGILKMSIDPNEEATLHSLERQFVTGHGALAEQVTLAARDSYKRLLKPSLMTEFKNQRKEEADTASIHIFAENLRQLLLAPPLGPKAVLALDPGYATGCKLVCLNASGDLLHHSVVFPVAPHHRTEASARTILRLVGKHKIEAIAIGNGTASREVERFVRGLQFDTPLEIYVVNESGASIYSASEVAREEFPNYDATVRGAISIGRRLMDPLAELVKIDPKSIGVGQYQHDVDQKQLQASLDRTVESCVNAVGVNVNTASKPLLCYVSGLSKTLAQNIVNYRAENGPFRSRKALMKVSRMGAKAFEQSAGFLRIPNAKNPLDATAVHPESYPIVESIAADLNCTVQDLIQNPNYRKQIRLTDYVTEQVGLPTLKDILQELEKPSRDPREPLKAFAFAADIATIEDLREGMRLPGIVTNITAFGAFVDIGIKQNGLIHKSQMANRFVQNPAEVVRLQQHVQVRVLSVDLERERIQLSLREA